MPRRNWEIRIQDIRHAADKIVSHVKSSSFEAFKADEWMQDAVMRNLAIIGEAAREIPPEIAVKHPEVPWDDMRDMRNIVVHEYFGVDLSIVWETISNDLPAVLKQLEKLSTIATRKS